jgi:hypothetical protein
MVLAAVADDLRPDLLRPGPTTQRAARPYRAAGRSGVSLDGFPIFIENSFRRGAGTLHPYSA